MTQKHILSGDLLVFHDDPFEVPPEDAVQIQSDAALLIENGKITARDSRDTLIAAHPEAAHHPNPNRLICPGFIDAHVH